MKGECEGEREGQWTLFPEIEKHGGANGHLHLVPFMPSRRVASSMYLLSLNCSLHHCPSVRCTQSSSNG